MFRVYEPQFYRAPKRIRARYDIFFFLYYGPGLKGDQFVNLKNIAAECEALAKRYKITKGKSFRLTQISPGESGKTKELSKKDIKEQLSQTVDALSELQERLYAQDRWGVLLIFQAADAAGKDGAIKNVMSGINPQGCQVYSFKAPSDEELDHDFLWRCVTRLPERGRIGIFNRSYYEEVLVVRVHPEILKKQKIPDILVTKHIWNERFQDIRNFEQYLARNGYLILKFFLHVSKDEQKKRFLDRLDDPEKYWKFSQGDVEERKFWTKYQTANEEMIQETAAIHAPWYVVPADNKWFTRLVIASSIVTALSELKLKFPAVSKERTATLKKVRAALINE